MVAELRSIAVPDRREPKRGEFERADFDAAVDAVETVLATFEAYVAVGVGAREQRLSLTAREIARRLLLHGELKPAELRFADTVTYSGDEVDCQPVKP